MDNRVVGVLGGGQLGRMLIEAANRLGVRVAVLDPSGPLSPAGQLTNLRIEGSFRDEARIRELATISDVITVEIEHVDTYMLEQLAAEGVPVHPHPNCIRMIQDKYLQKVHMTGAGVPCGEFMMADSVQALHEAGEKFGYPLMLKSSRMAYDGRGNIVVRDATCVVEAWMQLTRAGAPTTDSSEVVPRDNACFAEKWVPFVKELAVIAVRTNNGVDFFPLVETVQRDSICHLVIAPAQVSAAAAAQARQVCVKTMEAIDQVGGIGFGVYGIELFLLPDDTVLLNEVAPRPHNSGHYTIEACTCDQFEMHLRAILQLPCPTPVMKVPYAMMVNVLGEDHESGMHNYTLSRLRRAMSVEGAAVHWYGKNETRKGRKMAHVTIVASTRQELYQRAAAATDLDVQSHSHSHSLQTEPGPQVAVIMGSDSDLPTMSAACDILDRFNVQYECTIVSAHRTPTRMFRYAQTAADRGIRIIIAGAGGAAHLPGMVAALTPLPVIGVPVKTSTLNGQDSLLSIVQMPTGVPVATVAIGNAANAGLLAVRMLGVGNDAHRLAMAKYLEEQEESVLRKAALLESQKPSEYLEQMRTSSHNS